MEQDKQYVNPMLKYARPTEKPAEPSQETEQAPAPLTPDFLNQQ
jgi:hypothetical protein